MERIITFDYGMAIVLATAPTLARGYSGVMGSSFARSCTDVVSLCNFDRDCEWCLSRMGQLSQCWQFPTSLDVEADIALSSVCEHLNDEYCCLVESCHGNYLLAEVLGCFSWKMFNCPELDCPRSTGTLGTGAAITVISWLALVSLIFIFFRVCVGRRRFCRISSHVTGLRRLFTGGASDRGTRYFQGRQGARRLSEGISV